MSDQPIAVAAGVLVRDGKVLLCQRASGSAHAGKWEFPGGKLEPGESLEQCMRRELREELSVEVRIERALWVKVHHYPGRPPVDLTFFLLHPDYEGVLQNRVFADTRWVPIAALAQMDLLEGDRDFVAAVDCGEVTLKE